MGYKRPRSLCACCGLQVEWYSDGLSGGGHAWRCGNCFEGINEKQLKGLEDLQHDLAELEQRREQLIRQHMEG